MITVNFKAKLEKQHEYQRFRGMIILFAKDEKFGIKELVYANTDTHYDVYANFSFSPHLREQFEKKINEQCKIYMVDKFVTIQENQL